MSSIGNIIGLKGNHVLNRKYNGSKGKSCAESEI